MEPGPADARGDRRAMITPVEALEMIAQTLESGAVALTDLAETAKGPEYDCAAAQSFARMVQVVARRDYTAADLIRRCVEAMQRADG